MAESNRTKNLRAKFSRNFLKFLLRQHFFRHARVASLTSPAWKGQFVTSRVKTTAKDVPGRRVSAIRTLLMRRRGQSPQCRIGRLPIESSAEPIAGFQQQTGIIVDVVRERPLVLVATADTSKSSDSAMDTHLRDAVFPKHCPIQVCQWQGVRSVRNS